jgi:hypothetical protein
MRHTSVRRTIADANTEPLLLLLFLKVTALFAEPPEFNRAVA